MAIPDFSKKTIDTLARRARFQCSNPDCNVQTVGPNSNPQKSTTIGEAAHVYGAKLGAARYDARMSDVTRSAITNGIWLCSNCHVKVDRDPSKFSPELLFAWVEAHEKRMLVELGTSGDRIRSAVEMSKIDYLNNYPSVIHRIVVDKPDGWEWRFTAELMRHLNGKQFKRLENLRSGHYFRPMPRIKDEELIEWVQDRVYVMSNIGGPLVKIIDRLTKSWKNSDPGEMHDVCKLIESMISVMVDHEEVLTFSELPEVAEELRIILIGAIGDNIAKFKKIPEKLDEAVSLLDVDHLGTEEKPHVVHWELSFDLPCDFEARVEAWTVRYAKEIGFEFNR